MKINCNRETKDKVGEIMEKENELGKESIGKRLIKYSVPAIMSMMITSLYNIADRALLELFQTLDH